MGNESLYKTIVRAYRSIYIGLLGALLVFILLLLLYGFVLFILKVTFGWSISETGWAIYPFSVLFQILTIGSGLVIAFINWRYFGPKDKSDPIDHNF
jgi:uncharacterized RDD family membrane protein YckC